MIFTLRQHARSRRLRAMGVLAWLMLVVNALAAAPQGMAMDSHSAPAAISVARGHDHQAKAVEPSHAPCADQAACHGGMPAGSCHCAAMCSTTLLPATTAVPAWVAAALSYGVPRSGSAPALHAVPPLRPPLA